MTGANPKLTMLTEEYRGEAYELTESIYRIGRTPDMDIRIIHPTVSSMHCELILTDKGYSVVDDRYSSNGTRINGYPVEGEILQHGDILQIGSVECMYECQETEDVKSITSTNTNIDVMQDLVPNQTGNAAPGWLQAKNSGFGNYLQVFIGSAVAVVLILAGVLVWKIVGTS